MARHTMCTSILNQRSVTNYSVGFVFIGYDQYTELEWTLHRMRFHWKYLQDAPVSVVLSGDPDCRFAGLTHMVRHVPNIVRYSSKDLKAHIKPDCAMLRPGRGSDAFEGVWRQNCYLTPSESMFRNYQLGLYVLTRDHNPDYVVIVESNILLWEEGTIINLVERMRKNDCVVAAQTVNITGFNAWDEWQPGKGNCILPQLFVVDNRFCRNSEFLYGYINTHPECMEMSLGDNLDMALRRVQLSFWDNVLVGPPRTQWNIHENWDWVYMMHLDQKPGAVDNSSQFNWGSREEQLEFERGALRKRGITCLECPCQLE